MLQLLLHHGIVELAADESLRVVYSKRGDGVPQRRSLGAHHAPDLHDGGVVGGLDFASRLELALALVQLALRPDARAEFPPTLTPPLVACEREGWSLEVHDRGHRRRVAAHRAHRSDRIVHHHGDLALVARRRHRVGGTEVDPERHLVGQIERPHRQRGERGDDGEDQRRADLHRGLDERTGSAGASRRFWRSRRPGHGRWTHTVRPTNLCQSVARAQFS